MSSIIIEQQIAELKAELAQTILTKRERNEARRELDWLIEQQKIEAEAKDFASIEREAEAPHNALLQPDGLPF